MSNEEAMLAWSMASPIWNQKEDGFEADDPRYVSLGQKRRELDKSADGWIVLEEHNYGNFSLQFCKNGYIALLRFVGETEIRKGVPLVQTFSSSGE